MNVTMFKSLVDTKTPHYRDVFKIFELIRTGGVFGDVVDKIRKSQDKEERERLKKSLPITLFSGKFKARRHDALEEYNKLVCLDLDDVKNVQVRKFELEQLPYVFACWISPSGNGLKVLVKVLTENHLGHFLALSKDIQGVDPSGKDICRATFISKDDKIFINKTSEIYDKILMPSYSNDQKYENLKKWLSNKGDAFISGNRNSFITKLAGAANRFGIEKDFLKDRISEDFVKGSDFSEREMNITIDGVYERYLDQHASVVADEVWTDQKVADVLSTEIEVNDIITVGDLREDLVKAYTEGIKGGETTYYPELDNHFRWMRNEMTLVSGISNMGKSSILAQLLINKIVFENKKYIFFSPEQAPPIYFYREFIRTLIGKPLEENDPNRMSLAEYNRGLDFISSHVFYVYPEKESPTPDYIHARMAEAIIKFGADGTVIDPFSSMDNDYSGANGRDDKFLEKFLNKSQRFAIQNNLYYLIVTHPKNMNKRSDGTFECPDLFDIANGSTWSKRMDNILMYHRPNFPKDRSSPLCELKSIKIKKQALNGKPGSVEMSYDWKKGRFYLNGKCPLDNFKL
jgi:hypothetical protein